MSMMLGKNVAHLMNGSLEKGVHRFEVGNDLEAGIYFVRLQVNGATQTLKVLKSN